MHIKRIINSNSSALAVSGIIQFVCIAIFVSLAVACILVASASPIHVQCVLKNCGAYILVYTHMIQNNLRTYQAPLAPGRYKDSLTLVYTHHIWVQSVHSC